MAVIHVLDKHTAELIAAGEVVERPASVVKELLENSIDAGATQVTVSIESGGVKLIEICDNGTGIEAEYISTAFIRHATSKIHTLGFRGEALASIASVSRVELTTRTEADEFATVYCIEGGEETSREPGARAVGTTIRVKDLFYNTPARMKFLKKDASEGTFVAETVLHAALSHPEISFRYLRDGKQQYVTPGDGDLRSAVYAVLGREFARDLLPVDGTLAARMQEVLAKSDEQLCLIVSLCGEWEYDGTFAPSDAALWDADSFSDWLGKSAVPGKDLLLALDGEDSPFADSAAFMENTDTPAGEWAAKLLILHEKTDDAAAEDAAQENS